MVYLLVIAVTFAALFALDKGITKLFRSQAQHRTGTAVRLKKHYGVMSVVLMILGILGIITYFTDRNPALLVGGVLVAPGGALLGLYYLTHGVFYDDESFLYTSFGNRSATYRYGDIQGQKLYVLQGGSHVVELYMDGGKAVSIQTSMPGAYDFLDKAAHARMRQHGLNSAECGWFDPDNCVWFPPVEE